MNETVGTAHEAPSFDLTVNLTEVELAAVSRAMSRRQRHIVGDSDSWLALLLGAPVALVGGALAVIVGKTPTSDAGFVVVLLAAAYLAGYWLTYGMSLRSHRRLLRAIYSASKSHREDRHVAIDTEGVTWTSARSKLVVSWTEFKDVSRGGGLVHIWLNSTQPIAIPERCIGSAPLRDSLVGFIRGRIEAARLTAGDA